MSPQRWAPVSGCGIAGSAAASARARRPSWPHGRFAPGRTAAASGAGGEPGGRESPEGARGAEAPTGAGTARREPPACSRVAESRGSDALLLQHERVPAAQSAGNRAAPSGLQPPPGPTAASSSAPPVRAAPAPRLQRCHREARGAHPFGYLGKPGSTPHISPGPGSACLRPQPPDHSDSERASPGALGGVLAELRNPREALFPLEIMRGGERHRSRASGSPPGEDCADGFWSGQLCWGSLQAL